MSDLEEKEKHLNKLKAKVDHLLANHHPASDQIEVMLLFCFLNLAQDNMLIRPFNSCAHVLINHAVLVFP